MVLAGSGILLTTIGGGILGAVARGRSPRRESNLPPSHRVSRGARGASQKGLFRFRLLIKVLKTCSICGW